jgi:hypothetical protein
MTCSGCTWLGRVARALLPTPPCAFEEDLDLARDYLIGRSAVPDRPIRPTIDVPGRTPEVGRRISDVG